MFLLQIVVGSLCLITINANVDKNDDLVALVQIFRHGERTPNHFYKTDPHANHWKGLEPGHLTNEGRRQLYSFGNYTRNRYSDWIPLRYNRNFIYAQTTDVDRTHVSGQTFLYGLFPAQNDQVWLSTTDWQAIPLHPADPKVLWVDSANCPVYQALYANLLASDEFVEINEKYAYLYNLTTLTGDNYTELHDLEILWDTLNIEYEVGLNLPDWTKDYYPEPLLTVAGIWLESLSHTTQMKKFYTGPLLNNIINYFETMVKNATHTTKMHIYSAHDDNIAAILNSFGVLNYTRLKFGATLWLELRSKDNIPFVNIWYKNGEDLTQLTVKDCDLNCSLNDFKSKLSEIIVDVETWTSECSNTNLISSGNVTSQ